MGGLSRTSSVNTSQELRPGSGTRTLPSPGAKRTVPKLDIGGMHRPGAAGNSAPGSAHSSARSSILLSATSTGSAAKHMRPVSGGKMPRGLPSPGASPAKGPQRPAWGIKQKFGSPAKPALGLALGKVKPSVLQQPAEEDLPPLARSSPAK